MAKKFDTITSVYLKDAMQKSSEITYSLDNISEQKEVLVEDLEPVNISAELLYDICSGYAYMYEKLIEHELLTTGNKTNTTTLH